MMLMYFGMTFAQTSIQMEPYNGVYRIPCTLNGAKMKFVFDTGASNVCLSMTMAEYLLDNGYITKEDIVGNGSSTVADGRIVDHININIRDIEIQGFHLNNVRAVVIDGQNAPLLMGQSAIQKLGNIELSGSLLIIKNGENNEAFIDQLFNEADDAYQNGLYDRAIEKYSQLYSMKQLSDYGIFKYALACGSIRDYETAENLMNQISDFTFFENKKIDIYWFIGSFKRSLGKYHEAIKYFELSSKKIRTEYKDFMFNFKCIADCYYDANNYTEAATYYRYAATTYAMINGVDMPYLQRDSKNQLKKKETSFRNDEIDYILYQLFFCNERSGAWSTDGFLMEVTAMARANNKYALKHLNNAGINPYDNCWK